MLKPRKTKPPVQESITPPEYGSSDHPKAPLNEPIVADPSPAVYDSMPGSENAASSKRNRVLTLNVSSSSDSF